MTVAELIELLEQYEGDQEVRIASQPSWPFEYSISGIVDGNELFEREEESDEILENEYSNNIYLVEGNQLGYFTKRAWDLV